MTKVSCNGITLAEHGFTIFKGQNWELSVLKLPTCFFGWEILDGDVIKLAIFKIAEEKSDLQTFSV